MNFIIRQIKSTISVVIDLIMNTFKTTPTTIMNSKYQKIQFYKITQYLHKKEKTTLKITDEQFVLYLHHGIQIRFRYILGNDTK